MQSNRSIWMGLLLATAVATPACASDKLPPAGEWFPEGALLAVEVTGTEEILDLALSPSMVQAVASLPGVQAQQAGKGMEQLRQVTAYFESHVKTDWRTAARTLLGGALLAAYPDGTLLLAVDSRDAEMLDRAHGFFTMIAQGEAAKHGQPQRVSSAEYRGVTEWSFGPNESHAIVGSRLLLSNKPERLKSAIDLREVGGPSLPGQPEYLAASKAAGPDADAVVMVNFRALQQHLPVRKALSGISNPLGSLLLTGVADSLRRADTLGLALDVSGADLSLRLATDGQPAADGPAALARFDMPGEGALPNLRVPGFLAGLSFYRDLGRFYAAKNELFPERTSQLIFFENMMGIFFSGRDLTDEVLAETEPEIRLVVCQPQYDEVSGTPTVQIPAFAAVMRMKDPSRFAIVVEEAWQKAIGLINFTRGQKAEPGLIIDRPVHGDTQFTVARFAPPKVEERTDADVRFNFSPALAMPDGYLIFSSTESLARHLIDAVQREAAAAVAAIEGIHTLAEIDGANLSSILSANREQLVRNSMIQEGKTRQEAEIGIDNLVALTGRIGQISLQIGQTGGSARANLTVGLKLAEE